MLYIANKKSIPSKFVSKIKTLKVLEIGFGISMRYLVLIEYFSLLVTLSAAGDYNYSEVLEKSLLFYEAQRTGYLTPENRIPWRGDSFVTDQGDDGEDLSGGYFDGKFFLIHLR